ncbi:tetratricopeptide repeat protein [Umezawaea sp.]|uniref:tetratricopeptide repeat protein n=1 Tax=Umezawaea sp. TaxID=1955258 RepID=UPI002ED20579
MSEFRRSSPEYDVVNTAPGEVSGFLLQAGRIDGGVHHHHHHHAAARPVVSLPHRSGNVPPRAASFQRRGTAEAVAAGEDRLVTVLSGLGGVGKTQLAVDHVERVWAAGEVDLLAWISAGSRDAITSGYARVAADLTGVEDGDPGGGARRLLEWLANTSVRWLVVLDGVQSPGDLAGLWPPLVAVGRVLVTTRRRDTALRGHGRGFVDVGTFAESEALAYLASGLGEREPLLDSAAELVNALGCLPLALAQAVAYMVDRDLSCAAYLERLTDRRRSLAAVVPEDEALPDDHRTTVAATWSISVEHADRLLPAGMAGPLLDVAAFLNADGIPVDLFSTPAVIRYLTERVGRTVDAETAGDGLTCLHRLSLITVDGELVRVHALVQRATWDGVAPHRLPVVARAAADALVHLWPEVERDALSAQVLRANADALAEAGGEHLWHGGGHEVLFRAARSLGQSGLVADARTRFRQLHALAVRHLGADHPETLSARTEAARWQGETGDGDGAVRALRELLVDQVRVLGPDHPDVLETRGEVALWQARAGDPVGAATAFEELLPDQSRVLGADDRATLVTRANLITWSSRADDPLGPLGAFEELVADQVRVLGADHPVTLVTRTNLASRRVEAGDALATLSSFEELLTDLVAVFGPEHPTTLAARQALATSRGQAGDPAGAVEAYENLLADQLAVLGPDHPNTLITRHNAAHWTAEAGDPTSAVRALRELLPDLLRLLGAEHPHTLACRHALASARGIAGDPAGALAEFRELLRDQERIFGTDHPTSLDIRGTIALRRKDTGDLAGAVADLEDLQPDQRRVLGEDHPSTLFAREAIAAWRAETGEFATAVAMTEALLHDQVEFFGADDPSTLSTRRRLALWRRLAGDEAGALTALEELLPHQVRALGVDHPDTVTTRLAVAHGRGQGGDREGALAVLLDLLPDVERVLGADHPDSVSTRYLIELYRG